jgi:AcrR family transcriptional regulator
MAGQRVSPGLRELKKQRTRDAIRREALRLFLARGFEATAVTEIADAAGVSHMTFYRYFPSKEAVVLEDEYDPLIAEAIAAQPAELGPVERVRRALAGALSDVYETDAADLRMRVQLILATPALRTTLFDQQAALERLIVGALARDSGDDGSAPELKTRVVAAACAATMTTAVEIWGGGGSDDALPAVVDAAFEALSDVH